MEEKQRRKDEKKAAKAQAAEGSGAEEDGETTFDGVRSILAQRAVEADENAEAEDEGMEVY